MKHVVKKLLMLSCIAMALSLIPAVSTYAKETKSAVTYKLKNGVLTIKGKGKMPKKMRFKGNKKIKKVIIKKGVTSISHYAFVNCKNLESVKIANTVTKIGWHSFEGTKLENVTIPNSVKKIGTEAFDDCDELVSITMPGRVKAKVQKKDDRTREIVDGDKFESITFTNDLSLEILTHLKGKIWNVAEDDTNYKSINGVIYSKDGKDIVRVPRDMEELVIDSGCTTFNLQSILYGVRVPDDGVYAGAASLKKITVPATVTTIEDEKYIDGYATSIYDMDLAEIVIESTNIDANSIITLVDNLKNIVAESGENSIDIQKVLTQLGERITTVDGYVILDKTILLDYTGNAEIVTVPSGIKIIANKAFRAQYYDEAFIKKVILPEGLEEIRECAFENNMQLVEINLPSTLKAIEDYAFADTVLNKIEIPKAVNRWGEYIFQYSDLKEVKLPYNMQTIPNGMFYGCVELTTINAPVDLITVGKQAFEMTDINVKEFISIQSITTIEERAFAMTNWKELVIPAYIKKIGTNAFTSRKGKRNRVIIQGFTTDYKSDAFTETLYEKNKVSLEFEGGECFTDIIDVTSESWIKKDYIQIHIQWNKVMGIDGYTIEVCPNKKFKKNVDKYDVKSKKDKLQIKTDKDVKKLYVKIRPYRFVCNIRNYGRETIEMIYEQ